MEMFVWFQKSMSGLEGELGRSLSLEVTRKCRRAYLKRTTFTRQKNISCLVFNAKAYAITEKKLKLNQELPRLKNFPYSLV